MVKIVRDSPNQTSAVGNRPARDYLPKRPEPLTTERTKKPRISPEQAAMDSMFDENTLDINDITGETVEDGGPEAVNINTDNGPSLADTLTSDWHQYLSADDVAVLREQWEKSAALHSSNVSDIVVECFAVLDAYAHVQEALLANGLTPSDFVLVTEEAKEHVVKVTNARLQSYVFDQLMDLGSYLEVEGPDPFQLKRQAALMEYQTGLQMKLHLMSSPAKTGQRDALAAVFSQMKKRAAEEPFEANPYGDLTDKPSNIGLKRSAS